MDDSNRITNMELINQLNKVTAQRDRLAEALDKIASAYHIIGQIGVELIASGALELARGDQTKGGEG